MKKLNNKRYIIGGVALTASVWGMIASAQEPVAQPADVGNTDASASLVQAVDVDNRPVTLNKQGTVTMLLCTNEDSQEAARAAGKAMYPFQGRHDFRLVVLVDLRDSVAGWVPSVAVSQMKANLDKEAIELKPYYLKNGNKGNPRDYSEVVADFKGDICNQVGWTQTSDNLRAILFGADGREIKRWDKADDAAMLQADVKAALDSAKHHHHSDEPPPSEETAAPPVSSGTQP